MDYPVMLYLGRLSNYKTARDKQEYDELISEGYKTHAEVLANPDPEPVEASDNVEDALKQAYDYIELLEDEVEKLKNKLAVYETAKDTNNDGQVTYDEMTSAELKELLKQRDVEFKARDGKDALIKLAQDSE